MNNFLNNMQDLTLYKHINKSNLKSKHKNILENSPDDIQLEMVKYKNAVAPKGAATNMQSSTFSDYSSISELSSKTISATTSVKDNIASGSGMKSAPTGASAGVANVSSGGSSFGGSGSSLSGYSAGVSGGSVGGGIANISQFGLVKMTGTEGKNANGYTIGKDAKARASASLDYLTRDENGKPIAEIKDKDGNRLTKLQAKNQIQDIQAERRLVLSANPRLNLNDEQLDKIVRTTMSSYSESFGKEFEYMYAIHNNTSTPHAHILMTSKHPDGDGIKMYKDELFELKMNFEDAIKEEVKDSNINIKDNSTLPSAKQIGNFIGAVPDTNMFNQNKYLAYKISKKFGLEYDQKDIGNDPQKLEQWFDKNQAHFKEYFMSANNKEAFLFQEYSKAAVELSDKYDLGLTEKTTTDIKEFKTWIDDKKEVFLAERIAQDKHIILQKDDVQDSKKLYKWFMENESEVKEWNEEYKHHPSKQMSSLASKYGDMVDNKPDNLLNDRKVAREFVRNYTRDPLVYAGDSRKSLYKILDAKQQQFKNEFKEDRITEKSFNSEVKRLDSLKGRLLKGVDVTTSSLNAYNIDTKLFSKDTKVAELDGILLKDNIRKSLFTKIDEHKKGLDKSFEDKKIDEEHYKTYTKKTESLKYIISKSGNISISSLENIGLDKEKDLNSFKIEKVKTELQVLNFKNTDVNKNYIDIIKDENINKSRPLKHQLQKVSSINYNLRNKIDDLSSMNSKEINRWIDKHQYINKVDKSTSKIFEAVKYKNITIKSEDEYIKSYRDNINKKLDDLTHKLKDGKSISLSNIKATGIDTSKLETYQSTSKSDFIINSKYNLNKAESFKEHMSEKNYENFINQIKDGKASVYSLNHTLSNATLNSKIKQLPIDLKSNFLSYLQTEEKEVKTDMVKISSLKNILDDKGQINETVSNAIYNSPNYFKNIANRMLNEHGIELHTAKDLSDNFDKVGKPSELRELIKKTIHSKIDSFRETNDLKSDDKFDKYVEQIKINKDSKVTLTTDQKELNSLNGFLTKNSGMYPIFESDMKKIGANSVDFKDKTETTIKIDVVPNNDDNKYELTNAFDNMIKDSQSKVNSIKINDIDAQAINELKDSIWKKSEFRTAANEYVKNAINQDQSKKYVSAIIENKTLSGMSYMVNKNNIEDIPKSFLEARSVDTSVFQIEQKDKLVDTVTIGSKDNLEQFKEFIKSNDLETNINHNYVVPKVDEPTKTDTATNHITQDNYIKSLEEFTGKAVNNEIDLSSSDSKDLDTYYSLMELAIESKDINTLDKLYELDPAVSDNKDLLEIKFQSYADALDISSDDIYGKLLEKHFDLSDEDIEKLDNLKDTFDTYSEFKFANSDNNFTDIEDIKHQIYIEVLSELVEEKYDQFQWEQLDMDNENNSEENMKTYFESIQLLNSNATDLNDLVSKDIEIKALENEIQQNLDGGNFNKANELMSDERLDEFTRNTLEHIYNSMLSDEHVLDELHERILDNVELEENSYEAFKEEDFLNDMRKIDLPESQMEDIQNEIEEEMRQEEIEEQELELGM